MRVVAWIVVAVTAFATGGFAIPTGFALGLSALEVYLSASAGAMAGLIVFMFAGDKLRARLMRNRPPAETTDESRVRSFADRYGGLTPQHGPGDVARSVRRCRRDNPAPSG